MDLAAFQTFLIVEETKAASTVKEILRILRRLQTRGFDPDQATDRDYCATFLKHQRHRGVSEYKNNVQVVNALLRFNGIKDPFKFPKKKRSTPKRIKEWELERLRAYRHGDPLVALRNKALIEFALQTGLRRLEAARFNASDLDDTDQTLAIPRPAKGGLDRTIPLDPEFLKPRGAFMSWLRARPIVDKDPEAVWVSMGTGHAAARMADTKVGDLLQRIGRECGVKCNFTRTRHTRATELLRRGIHVRALQVYLGHSDLKSTMVYLEMDDHDLAQEFNRTRKRFK